MGTLAKNGAKTLSIDISNGEGGSNLKNLKGGKIGSLNR
jgi:hypothetical protein